MVEPQMIEIIIISILSLISGIVTSAFGFGAGLVLTPLLTFIMPVTEAIALSSLIYMFTSTSKAYLYRKDIEWRIYKRSLILAWMGLIVGFLIITHINENLFEKLFGVLLLIFAYLTVRNKEESKSLLPENVYPFLGGLASVLVHAGGLFFFRFARINGLNRIATVATLAGVHFTLNIGKTIFFIAGGYVAVHYTYQLIPAYIMAFTGAWIGRKILKEYINETIFIRGIATILVLMSIRFLTH
jgi:uncharacterized membrane protein YfcA